MWSQDKSLEQVGLTVNDFVFLLNFYLIKLGPIRPDQIYHVNHLMSFFFLLKLYLIKLGPILPDQIFQVVERLKAVKQEATKRMNRKEN